MTGKAQLMVVLIGAALLGCTADGRNPNHKISYSQSATRPDGAAEGTCWVKQTLPAVIVTETKTAAAGTTAEGRPAYKTTQVHKIVQDRQIHWLESVCPVLMTREFNESLQRALAVRNEYDGPVTGAFDNATRASVRAVQKQSGFDTDYLLTQTAQLLGLVHIAIAE